MLEATIYNETETCHCCGNVKIIKTKQFKYLSKQDSDLYMEIKDSIDEKDLIIKKLLEDKANASQEAHCNSKY